MSVINAAWEQMKVRYIFLLYTSDSSLDTNQPKTMRDLHTRCKLLSLERKCTDGVERLRTVLEAQLHNGTPHTDLWEKTVSFFTPKKALIFHDGYSKYSRETLRFFPTAAEDVAPLCFQQ